eukprot:CAMPEP_0182458370 /NCGR_PEP_ID=MMETSP1319-20130603/3723_1 /TAXON_ID=172717 /ORGANISM="Bolidomonas pacifica, Strain RCC208" /LENGTH=121 /DNA_ID=CAMNT_0024657043 /DNA_START=267 /DNA_END=629 /DNA_ORIENTATION=-
MFPKANFDVTPVCIVAFLLPLYNAHVPSVTTFTILGVDLPTSSLTSLLLLQLSVSQGGCLLQCLLSLCLGSLAAREDAGGWIRENVRPPEAACRAAQRTVGWALDGGEAAAAQRTVGWALD